MGSANYNKMVTCSNPRFLLLKFLFSLVWYHSVSLCAELMTAFSRVLHTFKEECQIQKWLFPFLGINYLV